MGYQLDLPEPPGWATWLIFFLGLLVLLFWIRLHELETRLEPKLGIGDPSKVPASTASKDRLDYIHFLVENTGGTEVRQCSSYIEAVTRVEEDGTSTPAEIGTPIELRVSRFLRKWRATIPPEFPRRFDFVVGRKADNWFGLAGELNRPYVLLEEFFHPDGDYDFEMAVTGREVPTVRGTVRVRWKNDWEDLKAWKLDPPQRV